MPLHLHLLIKTISLGGNSKEHAKRPPSRLPPRRKIFGEPVLETLPRHSAQILQYGPVLLRERT